MESWKTIAVLCAIFCTGYCAERHNLGDSSSERHKKIQEVMGRIEDFLPRFTDLEDKCLIQTKGQAAYNKIESETNKLFQCLAPLFETYQQYQHDLPNIATDLSDRPTLQLVIDNICGGFTSLRKCIRPLLDVTLVCLNPTEVKNMNSIWNAVSTGMDYACYNKGARYIELLEADLENCVKSRDKGVTQCADKLKHFMKNDMDGILEFNSKNCKVLFDARSCAVTELKQCHNKRSAEIMGEFFDVVLRKLPCDFHSAGSATTAVISNWIFTLVPFLAAVAL